VETGDDELKRYRWELGGESMRNFGDLAMILARLGQVHYAVQRKNELREQHQHRHSDGNAMPANP
jgi:hypothetical protein